MPCVLLRAFADAATGLWQVARPVCRADTLRAKPA